MRCEQIDATARPAAEVARALRALVPAGDSVRDPVSAILAAVGERGDEAVLEYTRRFDTGGAVPRPLLVAEAELDAAAQALPDELRQALRHAVLNVARVAAAGVREPHVVEFEEGHAVVLREEPLHSAAVYVPGGRAPYPSTVVMGVTTALAAGVEEIAVCCPPTARGEIDPVVLAACRLTGAHTVYRMGGAQAIAALAYGTELVAPVDVIVGPGNLYVQEAKRQVSGEVGIDGFAGPSDLLILAGEAVDAELVAADLLAQAEHGTATIVLAAATDQGLLSTLAQRLGDADETGAIARLVLIDSPEAGLELAEAFAPEHLQLVGVELEVLAAEVTRSGSVLVGASSATAFGDYIAGSNHVLPTAGAARFASALSPAHFRRRFTEVRVGAAATALAQAAAPLARAEGFEWHARSMEARIRENDDR